MLFDESFQVHRGEADAPANPQKRDFPVGDPAAHNARQKGQMIEGVEDPAYMVVADSIQELLRALHRATKAGKTEYAHIKLYNLVQSMTKDLGTSDPWDDDFVDYLEQVLDSVVELTRIDQTGRD